MLHFSVLPQTHTDFVATPLSLCVNMATFNAFDFWVATIYGCIVVSFGLAFWTQSGCDKLLASYGDQMGLCIITAFVVCYVRFRLYCEELQTALKEAIETVRKGGEDPEWEKAFGSAILVFLVLVLALPMTRERFLLWTTTAVCTFWELILVMFRNPYDGMAFVRIKTLEFMTYTG